MITEIVEWKLEFLGIFSCFGGRKGGIEEKGNLRKFILANTIRGDVHSTTKKEKNINISQIPPVASLAPPPLSKIHKGN